MSLIEAWEQAKNLIREKIGAAAFQGWLNKVSAKEVSPDTISLGVPDIFIKDWVTEHYMALIEDSLQKITGSKKGVELRIEPCFDMPQEKLEPFAPGAAVASGVNENNLQPVNLNPRYTFDNFVVGPSNRFSHAASLAVAQAPAKAYNPLFIYGGVGLGKTHLMQAICHHCLQKAGSRLKICYLSSEKFTNELIDAIQHHSTGKFRQKYRFADILVIDDVHFIAGKEATQEEFFHTFNALYDAHKQIIISSDRIPKEIPNMEERLVSRFSWGLVTDIQAPDFETRVAILKKKIEHEPIQVCDEVVFYIAELIKTNIRELEGALIRVVAYSLIENKPIDLNLAAGVLKDFQKENKKNITVDIIQKKAGEFFNIALHDIKTAKRNKNIVFARQVAMYLAREMTNLSLPEIGGFFGGKDHTTVLHSYNKIKEAVLKDRELKINIEKLMRAIQQ